MFGKAIGDAPLQVYVSALLFSPVESITRKQFTAEAPRWVRTWPDDVENWTACVQKFDGIPEDNYEFLSVSSCGTWLAARCYRTIMIWEVETGRTLPSIEIEMPVTDGYFKHIEVSTFIWFKFSPWSNNELVVQNFDRTILIFWDIATTEIVRKIRLPDAKVFDLSFLPSTPDMIGIVIGGQNKKNHVVFLNTQNEDQVHKKLIPPSKVRFKEIPLSSNNNDILAAYNSTTNGPQIIIYDIDTYDIIHAIDFRRYENVVISPDGKYVATSTKITCKLLDSMTYKVVFTICFTANSNGAPAFSADGRLLGVGSKGMVEIWDIAARQCIQKTSVTAYCPIFSPTRNNMLFCGSRGSIDVIEVGQHEMMSPLNTPVFPQKAMVSPNGRMLVSWRDHVFEFWNTVSGAHIFDICTRGRRQSFEPQFSPDSKRIALKSRYSLDIWDISSGRAEKLISDDTFPAQLSYLAVWDISSKKAERIFVGRDMFQSLYSEFRTFASSPNGQYLALWKSPVLSSSGHMGLVKIVDTVSRKPLIYLKTMSSTSAILSFSSDSKRLAAYLEFENEGNGKIQVEVWDIASITGSDTVTLSEIYLKDNLRSQISILGNGPYWVKWGFQQGLDLTPQDIFFSDNSHLVLNFGKRGSMERSFLRDFILVMKTGSCEMIENTGKNLPLNIGSSYNINPLGSWLTINSERVIWLPPEYRITGQGQSCNWDAKNGCIAISNLSRPLSILKFDCSACPGWVAIQSGGQRQYISRAPEWQKQSFMRQLDDDFFIILRLDMDRIEKEIRKLEK